VATAAGLVAVVLEAAADVGVTDWAAEPEADELPGTGEEDSAGGVAEVAGVARAEGADVAGEEERAGDGLASGWLDPPEQAASSTIMMQRAAPPSGVDREADGTSPP
jgi:hypothetical protein